MKFTQFLLNEQQEFIPGKSTVNVGPSEIAAMAVDIIKTATKEALKSGAPNNAKLIKVFAHKLADGYSQKLHDAINNEINVQTAKRV